MELDELKAAWRAVDARIQVGQALNAKLFTELNLERTPFAIVVMQGIFGFDIYRGFGARWIAANVAVGFALTPLLVWLARRLDDRRDGNVSTSPALRKQAATESSRDFNDHPDGVAEFRRKSDRRVARAGRSALRLLRYG